MSPHHPTNSGTLTPGELSSQAYRAALALGGGTPFPRPRDAGEGRAPAHELFANRVGRCENRPPRRDRSMMARVKAVLALVNEKFAWP